MKNSHNSIEQTTHIVKITKENITITLNFHERPIITSILLSILKPEIGFILLAYCLVYIFIFCVLMIKIYEVYLNSMSNLSPKTIERLDYFYNSLEFIINSTKSIFNFLYFNNTKIKRIE
jgi:hypothetical protein